MKNSLTSFTMRLRRRMEELVPHPKKVKRSALAQHVGDPAPVCTELSFSDLPSDVIVEILSFKSFVHWSAVPFDSISDLYGRFQDSTIHNLYLNVIIDDRVTREEMLSKEVAWRGIRKLKVGKYFVTSYLYYLLDLVVPNCSQLELYLDCEVVFKQKDRQLFDKLLKYADRVKSLSVYECPKEIVVSQVLDKFVNLESIMFGRTDIEDADQFVRSMKCRSLSLAWVWMDKVSFPRFLSSVKCDSLSLYVVDQNESYDTAYLDGLQNNSHIRSLRLVQKQGCLFPCHIKQIVMGKQIKSLSLDLENEIYTTELLEEVAKSDTIETIELTNYLNDLLQGIDLRPLTRMKQLKTLYLCKPFLERARLDMQYLRFESSVTILQSRKYLELE